VNADYRGTQSAKPYIKEVLIMHSCEAESMVILQWKNDGTLTEFKSKPILNEYELTIAIICPDPRFARAKLTALDAPCMPFSVLGGGTLFAKSFQRGRPGTKRIARHELEKIHDIMEELKPTKVLILITIDDECRFCSHNSVALQDRPALAIEAAHRIQEEFPSVLVIPLFYQTSKAVFYTIKRGLER